MLVNLSFCKIITKSWIIFFVNLFSFDQHRFCIYVLMHLTFWVKKKKALLTPGQNDQNTELEKICDATAKDVFHMCTVHNVKNKTYNIQH